MNKRKFQDEVTNWKVVGKKPRFAQPMYTTNGTASVSSRDINEYKRNGTLIGEGQHGPIYKSRTNSYKDIILKVGKSNDAHTKKCFELEAFALETLKGRGGAPKVIGVSTRGLPAIVQEYCPGRSLKNILQDKAVQKETVLRILPEIAKALHDMHSRNVVHNDLNQDNVIVEFLEDDKFKVSLVGLGNSTRNGYPIAVIKDLKKSSWLAPELCSGLIGTTASDVFSFGTLIKDVLKMKKKGTVPPAFKKICEAAMDPKCHLRPDLPKIIKKLEEALPAKKNETVQNEESFYSDEFILNLVYAPGGDEVLENLAEEYLGHSLELLEVFEDFHFEMDTANDILDVTFPGIPIDTLCGSLFEEDNDRVVPPPPVALAEDPLLGALGLCPL